MEGIQCVYWSFWQRLFSCIESWPKAGKNQSLYDLPKPSGNNLLTTGSAYLRKGPQAQQKLEVQSLKCDVTGNIVDYRSYHSSTLDPPCLSEVSIFLLAKQSRAFEPLFSLYKVTGLLVITQKMSHQKTFLYFRLDAFYNLVWVPFFKHC